MTETDVPSAMGTASYAPAAVLGFGVVQFALLLAVPSDQPLWLALAEGALVVGFGLTLALFSNPIRTLAIYAVGVAGLATVALWSWQATDTIWLGAVAVVLLGAILGYGIHRYEVVVVTLDSQEHTDGRP